MNTHRKLVGLGLCSLFDFSLGLYAAYCIGWLMDREVRLVDYAAAMAMAVLPDFDVLMQQKSKGKVDGEHRSWMHCPLILVPLVSGVAFLASGFSMFCGFLVPACLLAHFVHDTFEEGPGIAWCAPFQNDKYHLRFRNGKILFKMTNDELAAANKMTLEEWLEEKYLKLTVSSASGITMFLSAVVVIWRSNPPLW